MKLLFSTFFLFVTIMLWGQLSDDKSLISESIKSNDIKLNSDLLSFNSEPIDINTKNRSEFGLINNKLNFDSSIIGESNKLKDYKTWFRFSLCKAGFGYGFQSINKSNFSKSPFLFMNIIDLNIGFHKLGGLGFSTNLISAFNTGESVITSYCPVYLHYPLYMSLKKKDDFSMKSLVSIYGGGSLWCWNQQGSFVNEITPKYFQLGINYMFLNWASYDFYGIWLSGNFSIDASFIHYQLANSNTGNFLNISLIFSYASFSVAFKGKNDN